MRLTTFWRWLLIPPGRGRGEHDYEDLLVEVVPVEVHHLVKVFPTEAGVLVTVVPVEVYHFVQVVSFEVHHLVGVVSQRFITFILTIMRGFRWWSSRRWYGKVLTRV